MRPLLSFSIFFICFIHLGQTEEIGKISVSQIYLNPSFNYREMNRKSDFDIDDWFVDVDWEKDEAISGKIKLGGQKLMPTARFYENSNSDELNLLEVYPEFKKSWGRIRLGRIELPFSMERLHSEEKWWFPESLVLQNSFVARRDLGLYFENQFAGFYTQWAVHEGENGDNLDSQYWLTARWYFKDSQGFVIGFSAQTGRTEPTSTDPQGTRAPIRGFQVDENAKIFHSNFFFGWIRPEWQFVFDGYFGENRQGAADEQWHSLRADYSHDINKNLSGLLRLDSLTIGNKTSRPRITEMSLGFALKTDYEDSKLFVYGKRRDDQLLRHPDHSFQITWRVSSQIL